MECVGHEKNPPHCILSRFASLVPQVAYDYPQAPGCHVVDLSRNACMNIDGTEGGCNRMPECDPLTGALHFQYPLLTPTNVGIPALKTGSFTPSQFTDAPNLNLRTLRVAGESSRPILKLQHKRQLQMHLGKLNRLRSKQHSLVIPG